MSFFKFQYYINYFPLSIFLFNCTLTLSIFLSSQFFFEQVEIKYINNDKVVSLTQGVPKQPLKITNTQSKFSK